MQSASIQYRSSHIHYRFGGSGPRIAFCFHGYGEESGCFDFLEEQAGASFSLFAIDLPFHGQTDWAEGITFTITDLQQIVLQILQQHGKKIEEQPLTLVGFSLGGRMALHLYQHMPGHIERLVLLAPDGLKVNGWYWLATQTWAGKQLFAFTMQHPGWFFFILRGLNKLKLVNSSIFKFVNFYIGNTQVREDLYRRWICLRKIRPHIRSVKSIVKEQQTPVRLLYGQYDRIILPVVGERFCSGIEDHCRLTVIGCGHQVLHPKNVAAILHALQS